MCREKLYIVFALLFVMLASNVVAQAQPSLTIQNANVPVGNSVDVNVSFTNPESNVGNIQFDVVFDSDVAGFDNAVAGAVLSPWTIFVQERGPGRVTLGTIPDAQSPETVISEGDIFVLQFTGLAENTSTALDIEVSAQTAGIFSTFDGMAIEAGSLNAGSITVGGAVTPTPTPIPGSPTPTPQPSADGGGCALAANAIGNFAQTYFIMLVFIAPGLIIGIRAIKRNLRKNRK
ncbi:cohesin domain-containing protein [Desulfobacterota bacterium AH_259_B03_O07]|nr:cohesin domain-containing protein [Desulfobacterota bacterium AH_259_B03_O07]